MFFLFSLFFSYLEMFLQIILENFSFGMSNFRIFLFLAYLGICFTILHLSKRKVVLVPKNIRSIFLVMLIITLLVSLLSYIVFAEQYNLSYFSRYDTVHDGKITYTSFVHIHNIKGVLAKISGFLGYTPEKYDNGTFFADNNSFIWTLFFLLAVPTLFFLGLLVMIYLWRELKENKHKYFFWIMFIISLFSLLKSSVDGGPFNIFSVFWFSVMLGILLGNQELSKTIKIFIFSYFILLVTIAPFYRFFGGLKYLVLITISLLCFTLFLYGISITLTKRRLIYLPLLVGGFLVVMLSLNLLNPESQYNSINLLAAGQIEVPSGSETYIYTFSPKECSEVAYEQKDFAICKEILLKDETFQSIQNRYDTYSLSYVPIMVNGENCNSSHTLLLSGKFILINGKVPNKIEISFLNISFVSLNDSTYKYNGIISSCVPNPEGVISRIFNKEGIRTYIQSYLIFSS
jgi:hypothetical protein